MGHVVIDPVCGTEIVPDQAVANAEHAGVVYYFCTRECLRRFTEDPTMFVLTERGPSE